MAYKDLLPETNLSAIDIRDTIGCPSNNLSHYITKAKEGGRGGYAWNIKENGSARSDGTLIAFSAPYFNIYSKNSPCQWIPYHDGSAVDPSFICRLKRHKGAALSIGSDQIDNNCYAFDLGEFRGYRHRSVAPSIVVEQMQYVNITRPQEGVSVYFDPGDYTWYSAQGLSFRDCKYGVKVLNAGGGVVFAQEDASGGEQMVRCRPTSTLAGLYDMTLAVGLYLADGSIVARLPIAPVNVTVDIGTVDLTMDNRRFMGIEFSHNAADPLPGISLSRLPRATVNEHGDFEITLALDPATFPWIPGPAGGGEIWCDLHTTIYMPRPGSLPHLYGTLYGAVAITDDHYYNNPQITLRGSVPQWNYNMTGTSMGVGFRLNINK